MKYIFFSFLLTISFLSCLEEEELKVFDPIYLVNTNVLVDTVFTDSELPFSITFISTSKERVFVSTHNDQEYASSYSSATKVNNTWNP